MSDDLKRIWLDRNMNAYCSQYDRPPSELTEYIHADIAAAELRAARERIGELEPLARSTKQDCDAAHTRGWNAAIEAAIAKARTVRDGDYSALDWGPSYLDGYTNGADDAVEAIASLRKEQGK